MKLLRIKWENIISSLLAFYSIDCILSHIARNGFQFEVVGFEIIVYSLILSLIYVTTLSLRKDFLGQ